MKRYIYLFFWVFCLGIGSVEAQYTILHNFNDTAGEYPLGSLTLSGNKFYGMTYAGGPNYCGCIFSIDTNGDGYKDMLDFNGGSAPYGLNPKGSLTQLGAKLYGMTSEGGPNIRGNIFSIDTNGNAYRDLFDFNGTNGGAPIGSLTFLGNILCGMTSAGGLNSQGNIFSIDTDGNGFRDFYDFNDTDGALPDGNLTLLGNKFYGVTQDGWANGYGNTFSIDTSWNGYIDLFDLNGTDGSSPACTLTLLGRTFFGTGASGGVSGGGVIFSIDTNGSRYRDLFDFDGTNGAHPWGSLIISNRTLYGMTRDGGAYNYGCIFSIDTNGSGYQDLFNFDGTNGKNPYGSLTLLGDLLFGMTGYGGAYGYGVIFRFKDTNIITSISESKAGKNATIIFPNPNNGFFTLSLSNVNEKSASGRTSCTIEIYNVLGEQVYFATLKQVQGDNLINLSGEPNGVYLYRVLNENSTLLGSGKIIIDK